MMLKFRSHTLLQTRVGEEERGRRSGGGGRRRLLHVHTNIIRPSRNQKPNEALLGHETDTEEQLSGANVMYRDARI